MAQLGWILVYLVTVAGWLVSLVRAVIRHNSASLSVSMALASGSSEGTCVRVEWLTVAATTGASMLQPLVYGSVAPAINIPQRHHASTRNKLSASHGHPVTALHVCTKAV